VSIPVTFFLADTAELAFELIVSTRQKKFQFYLVLDAATLQAENNYQQTSMNSASFEGSAPLFL